MFERLPAEVQDLAAKAFDLFRINPGHPALHVKPIHDSQRGRHRAGTYSVRISLQYRALFVVDDETNVWYWIGSHADYDRFLGG